jgi:hypothetical protein
VKLGDAVACHLHLRVVITLGASGTSAEVVGLVHRSDAPVLGDDPVALVHDGLLADSVDDALRVVDDDAGNEQ